MSLFFANFSVKAMPAKYDSRSHPRWVQGDRQVVVLDVGTYTGHINWCVRQRQIYQLERIRLYELMMFEPEMVTAYNTVLAAV